MCTFHINGHRVDVVADNIKIRDSYQIKNAETMRTVINYIRDVCHDSEIYVMPLCRSDLSLINEWCGHNLCYELHLFRQSTTDVDLDTCDTVIKRIMYGSAAAIYKLCHKILDLFN